MKNFEADTINETQAIEHLKIFYPSIQNEIAKLSAQNNFPGIIQSTVDYLKVLLQESKINVVNRNIKMMEWLYKRGTFNVKHIIENLFIRSFGSLKKHTDNQQWTILYQYMPIEFQQIYLNQTKLDEMMFKKN